MLLIRYEYLAGLWKKTMENPIYLNWILFVCPEEKQYSITIDLIL